MPRQRDYDKVQARLGPELLTLFEAFRDSNGFDSSSAVRALIARGLYVDAGGDVSNIDEVAFAAAYANATAKLIGEIRRVLTGTPIHDMMRAVAGTVAKDLGVRWAS